MKICSSVSTAGKNPWITRAVIATAGLAVATVVVCGILSALVGTKVLALPAQFSVTNLAIAGAVGGVLFALLALAIRYCCCCREEKKNQMETSKHAQNTAIQPRQPQAISNPSRPLGPENGEGKNQGQTHLDPNAGGKTGAKGGPSGTPAFNVKGWGPQKNPLSDPLAFH
jgi:hypothetical protein